MLRNRPEFCVKSKFQPTAIVKLWSSFAAGDGSTCQIHESREGPQCDRNIVLQKDSCTWRWFHVTVFLVKVHSAVGRLSECFRHCNLVEKCTTCVENRFNWPWGLPPIFYYGHGALRRKTFKVNVRLAVKATNVLNLFGYNQALWSNLVESCSCGSTSSCSGSIVSCQYVCHQLLCFPGIGACFGLAFLVTSASSAYWTWWKVQATKWGLQESECVRGLFKSFQVCRLVPFRMWETKLQKELLQFGETTTWHSWRYATKPKRIDMWTPELGSRRMLNFTESSPRCLWRYTFLQDGSSFTTPNTLLSGDLVKLKEQWGLLLFLNRPFWSPCTVMLTRMEQPLGRLDGKAADLSTFRRAWNHELPWVRIASSVACLDLNRTATLDIGCC